MKFVPLSRGLVARVDDQDFDRVSRFKWYARPSNRNWYAVTMQGNPRRSIFLHHFILGTVERIDHRDNNGLNNQRENLRKANRCQNGQNRRYQIHSSKFKGVSWCKGSKKWEAYLSNGKGKKIHLGWFVNEIDAALAYDAAALNRYGEFALTNEQLGRYAI